MQDDLILLIVEDITERKAKGHVVCHALSSGLRNV